MMEIAKAAGMYALTGAISALAGRYHLDGSQTAALMADAVAVTTAGTGIALHWFAYQAAPPK